MTPSIKVDEVGRHAGKCICSQVDMTDVPSRELSRQHGSTDRKAQASKAKRQAVSGQAVSGQGVNGQAVWAAGVLGGRQPGRQAALSGRPAGVKLQSHKSRKGAKPHCVIFVKIILLSSDLTALPTYHPFRFTYLDSRHT